MSARSSSPPRRLVDDRLWRLLEPLIPPPPRARGPGGRPRRDDRLALEGILFVLITGIGWAALPAELGSAPAGPDGHQDPAPAAGAESAARPPPTARR